MLRNGGDDARSPRHLLAARNEVPRRVTRLLFIEDDRELRTALRLSLEDEGYRVVEADDGERGLQLFAADPPELVLLDLRLPGIGGLEVCRRMRQQSIVPIIIVTAQTDTHDLVAGLEAGADDYVTKPLVPKALAARIRALLRRISFHESEPAQPTTFGDLEIRPDAGIVTKAGQPLSLTRTEFKLLCEFALHPNQILNREQLLERVWGYEYLGDSRLVDSHIRRLRTKIEDDPTAPQILVTVRGLGYRMQTA
jgi:DNA-binding response OmpR family regulator